jgi:hypothetical protein
MAAVLYFLVVRVPSCSQILVHFHNFVSVLSSSLLCVVCYFIIFCLFRSGRGDIPLGSALADTTVETKNTDPATGIAELWIGHISLPTVLHL